MNLQIIDFQTAKVLKELGFDWLVDTLYKSNKKFEYFLSGADNWNNSELCISAPTQAEVAKWLRDKHDIHVSVSFLSYWWYNIIYLDENKGVEWRELWFDMDFKTYEQAELAGIKKAIEILKKQNYDTQ